jgi:hypothetical protein
MKIALVLHGQPRNYRVGFEHLNREIMTRYDCDVFGHTWWAKDDVGQKYETAPWAPQNYQIEDGITDNLNNLYKFKAFKHSPPKRFAPTRTYNVSKPENHDVIYNTLCSRFYSLKESLQLVECWKNVSGTNYDFVVITRYDIGLFSPLPKFNFLDRDKIYVSDMHGDRRYVFNDLFWIAGVKYLSVFKTIYENLDIIYDKLGHFTEEEKKMISYDSEALGWTRFNGEELISVQFIMNGMVNEVIKDSRLNYNMIR